MGPSPKQSLRFSMSFSCKADGVVILWLLLNVVEQDSLTPSQKDGLYISFRSGEEIPTIISQKMHLLSIFIYISINNYEERYHITFQINGRKFVGYILNSSGVGDKSTHV